MEVRPTEILLCFSMTYWGTAVRSVEDVRETINVYISQGEWPAGAHRVGKRVGKRTPSLQWSRLFGKLCRVSAQPQAGCAEDAGRRNALSAPRGDQGRLPGEGQ